MKIDHEMLPAISCLHPKKLLKNRIRFFNSRLESKLVTVAYDGEAVTPDASRAAIEARGYEVAAP
jgi:copper chaperone CopZ